MGQGIDTVLLVNKVLYVYFIFNYGYFGFSVITGACPDFSKFTINILQEHLRLISHNNT